MDLEIPKAVIAEAFQFGVTIANPDVLHNLTVAELGRLYAEYYPATERLTLGSDDTVWVWELMQHIGQEEPLLALDCIVAALRHPITPFQASCIAAGVPEYIIAYHGQIVIAPIEALAAKSARFRYMLSGVWPLGKDKNGEIWQRVQRAIGPGPYMDQGAPVPPADL